MAPEILTRQGYGKEVDMWTCGVILYVLLAGYPPFWDPRNRERVIEAKIKRAEYEFDEPAWKDISPSAKELISQLMTLDVEKRLTAEECFEDHEHRHDRSGAPEWLRDDTEAMDCPRFRRPTSASILTAISRAGHIPHFCDNMHKYVLRRHLKGAVDAVIATKRMGSSRLMGLFASASETPTSGAATEATPAAEAPAAATTA